MRNRLFVGIVMLFAVAPACASRQTLLNYNSRDFQKIMLRDEANEFYNALRDKKPEKMWQLLSPFVKKENQKEDYVADVKLILSAVTDLDYSNLTVVYMSKRLAVTQIGLYLKYQEGDKEVHYVICERAIWLRFPEGWRIQEDGLSCSYMPDKQRMKFLTKNVPDP